MTGTAKIVQITKYSLKINQTSAAPQRNVDVSGALWVGLGVYLFSLSRFLASASKRRCSFCFLPRFFSVLCNHLSIWSFHIPD